MHVRLTAEHMFKYNSGATLQLYGSRQNTYGSPSLSYIQRLQGIHTFLCKVCPFISQQHPGLEGFIPVSRSPEQHCHGQRKRKHIVPHHDSATICKTEFSVFPQLLNEYRFNARCTDPSDLLCRDA